MSTHVLWGRPQDLAFEQIVGGSPRRRHHVRLWRANRPADPRDTLWLGAASYDARLGFSRYTGEVIHHIDTRVDGERDRLFEDLRRSGRIADSGCGKGLGTAARGFNGAGDAYETDGRLCVAVLGRIPGMPTATRSLEAILVDVKEAAAEKNPEVPTPSGRARAGSPS